MILLLPWLTEGEKEKGREQFRGKHHGLPNKERKIRKKKKAGAPRAFLSHRKLVP